MLGIEALYRGRATMCAQLERALALSRLRLSGEHLRPLGG